MKLRSARHPAARPTAGLLLAATLVAGCGEGKSDLPEVGAPTYPASGKVLRADGSPMPSGNVIFVPADPKAPPPMGAISGDGTFSLVTGGATPGAPAGDYKVRIELDPDADPRAFGKVKKGPPIPPKYSKEESSGLTATVRAEGTNEFTFTLK